MIAMRDGVRLHTNYFVPKGFVGNLPIIMIRTPYGIEGGERGFAGAYAELAREGYIFVHQDIRGRYKSEGQFVMLRQMRDKRDPKAIDEATDTYDTIEWLLKNVPRNNGRVGMMGVSYPGWLTVVAMLDPHPALKAVSPQASPADMFIGDDFHHNGAFRLSYGFEYAVMMESSKERSAIRLSGLRHVRLVSQAGIARARQREVSQRQDSELERFRRHTRTTMRSGNGRRRRHTSIA